MIDYFAIALTHALILLTALRLLTRGDLDRDPAPGESVASMTPGKEPVRRKMVVRQPAGGEGAGHA